MAPDGPVQDAVAAKVIDIVAKYKKMPPSDISLDSAFADLGVDSLDAIDLIFEFEDAFDVDIPTETAQQMRGIRQAAEALSTVLAERASQAG